MSKLPHLPILPVVIFAAVLAIGSLAYTTTRYFIHNYQLHQDEAQIRRDIAGLDSDRQRLVAVRDYLKSDEYLEDIARRVLGLVRPGETLVVVSGNGPSPTAQPLAGHTPGGDWWKSLFPEPQPTAAP